MGLHTAVLFLQAAPVSLQTHRYVSLHEHHSMDLMNSFGISVPRGELATTAEQARDITHRLGMHVYMYMYIYMYIYVCSVNHILTSLLYVHVNIALLYMLNI